MATRTFLAAFQLFVFCASVILCGTIACAHPFHLCVGQMKWNTESKVWEVSLRLHPQDLELAMTNEMFAGDVTKKVSTEDSEFPAQVTEYLGRHFFLRKTPKAMNEVELDAILRAELKTELSLQSQPKKGGSAENESSGKPKPERSAVQWVGMEQEKGWLWLHIEVSPPTFEPSREKLWLVHRLLLESVGRQENTISVDPTDSKKFSLQFQQGASFREFKPK